MLAVLKCVDRLAIDDIAVASAVLHENLRLIVR